MNRILLCAALALGLAACGGEPPAPAGDAATPPPATESVPAPAAEPVAPPPKLDQPVADGETVEDATIAASPIAAAVAASTPALAPAPAAASKWKVGVNYTLLPVAQPVSTPPGDVEVTVVFWYGCGHCFTLEPYVDAWEAKGRPDYVKLVRMPVVWNEVAREDARLFYTLEALGKLKELNMAVFREMHINRNPMTVLAGNKVDTVATEKNVREFLLANGVSSEDFSRVYRSFSIENKLRQAENLSRRYLADHTPMVVVQGKYVTDVTMAGGFNQLFEVIDDLAARERSGG